MTSTILILVLAAIGQIQAQEAWVLEMPNKYSDYLLKKAAAGEGATVDGIVEKIPDLIAKKQIREIELITWKAEGGKLHPKKTVSVDGQEMMVGSTYTSMGGTDTIRRTLNIKALPTERNFIFSLIGPLSKTWTPTFASRSPEFTVLVLERNALDGESGLVPDHTLQITFDATAKASVTWYASTSLDAQQLTFHDLRTLAANPKITYGIKIFSSVRKTGESLMRLEAHHVDPANKESIVLNHNQANLNDFAPTSGPLNKETITIADKSVSKDGEDGTWSVSMTGE